MSKCYFFVCSRFVSFFLISCDLIEAMNSCLVILFYFSSSLSSFRARDKRISCRPDWVEISANMVFIHANYILSPNWLRMLWIFCFIRFASFLIHTNSINSHEHKVFAHFVRSLTHSLSLAANKVFNRLAHCGRLYSIIINSVAWFENSKARVFDGYSVAV